MPPTCHGRGHGRDAAVQHAPYTSGGEDKRQSCRRSAREEGHKKRREGKMGRPQVNRNGGQGDAFGGAALVSTAPFQHGSKEAAPCRHAFVSAASNCHAGPRRSATASSAPRCDLVIMTRPQLQSTTPPRALLLRVRHAGPNLRTCSPCAERGAWHSARALSFMAASFDTSS